MKKKMLAIALMLSATLSVASPALATNGATTFSDVFEDNWAYAYVEKAAERGWVSGYTDGRYGPEDQVSYAQFAVMVIQAVFRDRANAYQSTDGEEWFLKYTVTANELGLFQGTSLEGSHTDRDMVSMQLSRYEMGQLLYNTIAAAGLEVDTDQTAAASNTGDWDSIPAKYQNAVAAVKDAGLISGTDSVGTFDGNGIMNRAQAAVVMCKLDEVLQATQENKPPETDPNESQNQTADTIVYVSTRSNTIHSVSNCGGMKNYREMTIEAADSCGYSYCPNCW